MEPIPDPHLAPDAASLLDEASQRVAELAGLDGVEAADVASELAEVLGQALEADRESP